MNPARSGSVVSPDKHGNIWLFGGLLDGKPGKVTNDLWVNGKETGEWERVNGPDADNSPRPRMYSTGNVVTGPQGRQELVIFGGWDTGEAGSGGTFLDDVWSYDIEEKRWSMLDVKLPYPVSRHTSNVVPVSGKEAVVLHTFKCNDEVILYDAPSRTFKTQKTTGPSPQSLSMISSSTSSVSPVVLYFGGSSKTGEMSGDVHVLDCESWSWTNHQTAALPRSSACSCNIPGTDNFIIGLGAGFKSQGEGYQGGLSTCGDLHLTCLTKGEKGDISASITEIEVGGVKPTGRVAANIVPFKSSGDKCRLLLQGGWNPKLGVVNGEEVLDLDI